MNQDSLRNALNDSVVDAPVGVPPLGDIYREASRSRRRRFAAVVSAATLVVLAAVIVPGVLGNGGGGSPIPVQSDVSTPASPSPSVASGDELGSDGFPNDARLSDQPWGGKNTDLLGGMTQLKDCPEALEYFQRPEVKKFYEEHLGRTFGPQDSFAGGCPDVGTLQSRLEAAR